MRVRNASPENGDNMLVKFADSARHPMASKAISTAPTPVGGTVSLRCGGDRKPASPGPLSQECMESTPALPGKI